MKENSITYYKKVLYGATSAGVLYLLYPYIFFEKTLLAFKDFYKLFFCLDIIIPVIVTTGFVVMTYNISRKTLNNSSWKEILLGIMLGSIISMLLMFLVSIIFSLKYNMLDIGEYPTTGTKIPYNLTNIENIKYFIFVIVYTIMCYELGLKIHNIKCGVYSHMQIRKINFILSGVISAIILYVLYPYISFETYVNEIHTILTITVIFIIVSIELINNYFLLKNVQNTDLQGWRYIITGNIIGILAMILLITVISKYKMYNINLPINLLNITNLKFYLYIILQTIFLKKLYIKIFKVEWKR